MEPQERLQESIALPDGIMPLLSGLEASGNSTAQRTLRVTAIKHEITADVYMK